MPKRRSILKFSNEKDVVGTYEGPGAETRGSFVQWESNATGSVRFSEIARDCGSVDGQSQIQQFVLIYGSTSCVEGD